MYYKRCSRRVANAVLQKQEGLEKVSQALQTLGKVFWGMSEGLRHFWWDCLCEQSLRNKELVGRMEVDIVGIQGQHITVSPLWLCVGGDMLMVDIPGGAVGVSGDLLGLWEGFLVSNSAQTVRSHQEERWGLTPLKLPVLLGWGTKWTSLGLESAQVCISLSVPKAWGWSGHLFGVSGFSLFYLSSVSLENWPLPLEDTIKNIPLQVYEDQIQVVSRGGIKGPPERCLGVLFSEPTEGSSSKAADIWGWAEVPVAPEMTFGDAWISVK